MLQPSPKTQALITARLKKFWGYGSLDAHAWCIGMEEGLSPHVSDAELLTRLESTQGRVTVDMRTDMQRVHDHMQWFTPHPKIQPSWKYPIALYLHFTTGNPSAKEERRAFQEKILGDVRHKQLAVLELMPLPSQKADERTWRYGATGVPGLESRSAYIAEYKSARVLALSLLIKKHTPALVIFYSLTYFDDWCAVMSAKPKRITHEMYATTIGKTTFCIIPQGVYRGMSYKRIDAFAKKIRQLK